jgi:enterochelin esterase-like enzyme
MSLPVARRCVLAAVAGVLLMAVTPVAAQPTSAAPAGTIRTDTVWAPSVGARKALVVYLPPSYDVNRATRYPLLVYLHGRTGNERDWVNAGRLNRAMDSLVRSGGPEAIIAMPDGDDGWYTTWNRLGDVSACMADTARPEPAATYCVPWTRYDDYIARDIVAHMDARYRTLARRESRGVAGLGMGGYGALTLALRYPDVFAVAASHSGAVSPRYLGPKPFADPPQHANTTDELQAASRPLWGGLRFVFGTDTIGWNARDPGRMAQRLQAWVRAGGPPMPALMFDIGSDDDGVDQNRDLHHTLDRLGVPHRYAEWPGAHAWRYWQQHAAESLQFLLRNVTGR